MGRRFEHAIAKNAFAQLSTYVWWREIRGEGTDTASDGSDSTRSHSTGMGPHRIRRHPTSL